MNLLKEAFKISKEDKAIYRGFGLSHLSDVTHYYVHPNNESRDKTTTLAQPIGEAVIAFSYLLDNLYNDTIYFDGSYNDDSLFIQLNIPNDLEEIFYGIHFINISLTGDRILIDEPTIIVDHPNRAKMDKYNKSVLGLLSLLFKLTLEDSDFLHLVNSFINEPTTKGFVKICEDFYQAFKNSNYGSYGKIFSPTHYQNNLIVYYLNQENNNNADLIKFNSKEFTKEALELIPDLSEEFILPPELTPIANAVSEGDILSLLFYGPAGTGKTINCKLIAQAIECPLIETINCTENLDEFILGKYIPKDDKIVFQESYVTKAIREGGIVVFEEINFAKPQYLAFLNSLLDDNGFVRLDNGEVVRRHKNFRFFATMNIGYYGTRELNQSLYNRFNAIINIPSLSEEAIKRMLLTRVPESEQHLDKILSVYRKLKNRFEESYSDFVISPRNLENWARLAKYQGYINAAESTIVPIAKDDEQTKNTIRSIINAFKWN